MPAEWVQEDLSFRYRIVDLSELDGEPLLSSDDIGDNVLAILAHLRNQGEAIRMIVERIARLNPAGRHDAMTQLLIVSGLRALSEEVREQVKHMPITENILDHPLIGPAYREGKADGERAGRLQGQVEGERAILIRLIEKRFGQLPERASKILNDSSSNQIDSLSMRLFDVSSLDELFGN